jgi:hypothetical protein
MIPVKPIKIPEGMKLVTYAENQPEYLPLPVLQKFDQQGGILITWKLSFIEKMQILFTGRLYQNVLTFYKPLQPIKLETKWRE